MAEYYNVTTNLGDAEIANAIATNTKLDITHVAFGDGNGSVPTPTKTRTSLVREVHRQAVTKYERHATNVNWIVIETIIPSDIGGFTIREIGIIANGKLISHGSHAPFEKVTDPSGVSEYRLRFTQNVTDGSVVELTLDESLIYATQAWIDENYIKRSEIVDNLTTDDATKPLSAKQGEVLDEKITNIPVYSLPTASTTAKGGVKVGTGLSIANEVLSVSLNNTLTSTSDTQALTAAQGKNLNDKMFGVDQGWKNITASTILNTEYTNTNPKTIFVTGVLNGDDQSVTLTVRNKNGDVFEIKCGTSPSSPGDVFHNVSAPIAPGESYKFSRSAGTLTIWMFS